MDERLQKAILEDLARAVDMWATTASRLLTDPSADIGWAEDDSSLHRVRGSLPSDAFPDLNSAMFEVMQGLMHSALAVFDGASESAEIGRILVNDERGEQMDGALHELFVEHLFDTGRLA